MSELMELIIFNLQLLKIRYILSCKLSLSLLRSKYSLICKMKIKSRLNKKFVNLLAGSILFIVIVLIINPTAADAVTYVVPSPNCMGNCPLPGDRLNPTRLPTAADSKIMISPAPAAITNSEAIHNKGTKPVKEIKKVNKVKNAGFIQMLLQLLEQLLLFIRQLLGLTSVISVTPVANNITSTPTQGEPTATENPTPTIQPNPTNTPGIAT